MINKKGLLLVVSGPSGTGKGTICKDIVSKHEDINLSISATTRKPRIGEVEGKSYFFKTKEEFEAMVDRGEFLEYAMIYDNYYGTPKKAIFDELDMGRDVILEIEMQGAMQIKEVYPHAVFIFALPTILFLNSCKLGGRTNMNTACGYTSLICIAPCISISRITSLPISSSSKMAFLGVP